MQREMCNSPPIFIIPLVIRPPPSATQDKFGSYRCITKPHCTAVTLGVRERRNMETRNKGVVTFIYEKQTEPLPDCHEV
ncbi:hypothetical protein E2C01_080573 [Portunus trituberculatus]|uniref:Uncharacterized protein n=1 Tax=Portunus trituberculatus TaxID=210409 RepID=A0A5B7IUF0_PORTR|nr:hypothetical protein [Portunus trituberculatus]